MLVKLELSYKVIRKDTLYDFIKNSRKTKEEIDEELKFASIVTRYGQNSKAH
jgi:hypothetical protein